LNSPEYAAPPSVTSRTRLALHALWAALTIAALGFVLILGSNCPNADEWDFVPALLNREPLGPWLWAQHNEHRLPLPRLVYYTLFQFTHDFRGGAVLQVMLLSGTSLGLMILAARFRGQPHWVDAFFPVSLVHAGHWENLLIGYNLCFAFILVLETAIGVIALRTTRETAFRSGCRAGFLAMLLCLCGGGGVVTAMPVAAWLVYLAFLVRPRAPVPEEARIRNPIESADEPDEKLKRLQRLTDENRPLVDAFLKALDAEFGTASVSNVKQPDRIRAKAERPSIRAKKPWHDIEYVRDSFRFKTVLKDLRDLPAIVHALETRLGATIIKRDTGKFLIPGIWGWRIVAFDLRMPNGQLVEYYLPVEEIERAKNEGNHELFERWRNRDESKLTKDDLLEYSADVTESRAVYEAAFASFLDRTGSTENEVRAVLRSVSASTGDMQRNSSSGSVSEKSISGTQVTPPSRLEAMNASESSTQTRPSPSREIPPIAMFKPPTHNLPESRLRANGKSLVLLLLAAFPMVYLAVYLQGYRRPGHHPEVGEGGADVLVVAARVMSLAFGTSGSHAWPWMFAVVAALIGITAAAALRSGGTAKLGLLAILAGIVGVAVVIGLGRAGIDPRYGLSSRYGYLVWPLIALPALFWIQRGGRLGKWIPAALCIVAVLRFNANMLDGLGKGSTIKNRLEVVQVEAAEGVPPEAIVRHFKDTFQANQEQRAIRAIPLLRDAGIGMFGEARR
jgi:hypothetical protein